MAQMPFTRYLARIVGERPAPYVLEAMELLWGEEAIRKVVQARKTDRVRNYYCFVRRQFRQCDEAVGRFIRIDHGEMMRCDAYGRGHVYLTGIVETADIVIVESKKGIRSIAFEVHLVRGSTKRNGRFVKRIRDTLVVMGLPRGDRGMEKEQYDGRIADSGRRSRNSDPRNVATRGSSSSFHRRADSAGPGASK